MEDGMSIVGVDLAGVETRPTGYCLLKGLLAKSELLYTDQDILEKTFQVCPKIVAIDAPLYLPPGRKSLEDRNGPHLRESDRELLKMGIKIFPATLGPMRKLTARGMKLRGIFEAKGLKVIEAYPGGAQDVLGIPRKKQGLDKLLAGLELLGLKGLNVLMSNHELDAVTCAYVGKLFVEDKAVVYGSPHEGIVLPKRER
jgi:predicted nuclease with RNAse H fold